MAFSRKQSFDLPVQVRRLWPVTDIHHQPAEAEADGGGGGTANGEERQRPFTASNRRGTEPALRRRRW